MALDVYLKTVMCLCHKEPVILTISKQKLQPQVQTTSTDLNVQIPALLILLNCWDDVAYAKDIDTDIHNAVLVCKYLAYHELESDFTVIIVIIIINIIIVF